MQGRLVMIGSFGVIVVARIALTGVGLASAALPLKTTPIECQVKGDTLLVDVDFLQGDEDVKNQWSTDRPSTPLLELSVLPGQNNPRRVRGQWASDEKDRALFVISSKYLGQPLRIWPRVQMSRTEFRFPLVPWGSDCAVFRGPEAYWAMTLVDSSGVVVKRCYK